MLGQGSGTLEHFTRVAGPQLRRAASIFQDQHAGRVHSSFRFSATTGSSSCMQVAGTSNVYVKLQVLGPEIQPGSSCQYVHIHM